MTPAIQRRLLVDMLRIRAVEEAVASRYGEQEMRCPVHLSIGQEAVAVGVCGALTRDDYVMSTHRSHAHYLAKGGSLERMLAEIYGRATGCCGGKGGSMHIVDLSVGMLGCTPIVGGSLPVAVGTAFGNVLRGEDRVSVAFFGEGATEEGVFAESLNFAALERLPMIFVCENNFYSVYSPMEVRQPATRSRVEIARAHGLAAACAAGNDVEAVYALTVDAVARAHAGGGPTFLEFDTYRWREHCGPHYDNDIGYRTEAEFEAWRARCPVEGYRARLMEAGIVGPEDIAAAQATIDREVADAFAFAKSSPFPAPESAERDVYDGVVAL